MLSDKDRNNNAKIRWIRGRSSAGWDRGDVSGRDKVNKGGLSIHKNSHPIKWIVWCTNIGIMNDISSNRVLFKPYLNYLQIFP